MKKTNGNYFVDSLIQLLFDELHYSLKHETAHLFVSILCIVVMERKGTYSAFFLHFFCFKQDNRQKQCFAVASFILLTTIITVPL